MEWLMNWGAWHWLILGLLLLIAEVLVPGVFLLWWGLAGIFCAALTYLLPDLSLTVVGIIYALISFLFSFLWWKYQHQKDKKEDKHSSLNQRDHAMLGRIGMLEQISANNIGRGKFGDTTWRIQGENLIEGDKILVVSVKGITLNVIKYLGE